MEICIGEYSLPGGYTHVKWETKTFIPVPEKANIVKVFVSEEELREEFDTEEMGLIMRGWYWIARRG